MSDHLHIYNARGRCITSVPLSERTLTSDIPATDQSRVSYASYPMGYPLVWWNTDERAGLSTCQDGETMILRIKSTGIVRDMLPAGVTSLMNAMRRDGFEVETMTGLAPGTTWPRA